MALPGCLGGTVAQQIARSIATSVADSAVANALDVQEREEQDRFSQYKKPELTKNTATQQNIPQQSLALQGSAFNTAAANSTIQSSSMQNLAFSAAVPKAVPNIAQQIPTLPQNTLVKEAPIDPYKLAFINAQFQSVRPEDLKPITEPLPSESAEAETPVAVVQSSQLVPVELFNLLIGEEKAAVYTKAQLIGATSLPNKREWKLWRVATGVIKNNLKPSEKKPQQIITFLIPPDFGKLPSGSVALVEIANPGELNIARYKIN